VSRKKDLTTKASEAVDTSKVANIRAPTHASQASGNSFTKGGCGLAIEVFLISCTGFRPC